MTTTTLLDTINWDAMDQTELPSELVDTVADPEATVYLDMFPILESAREQVTDVYDDGSHDVLADIMGL